jgi:hypothetical protein
MRIGRMPGAEFRGVDRRGEVNNQQSTIHPQWSMIGA